MMENSRLSHKYKTLAMIDYMRCNNKLPECGSNKNREPQSVAPEDVSKPSTAEAADNSGDVEKSNEVISAPAFSNVRLNIEEENLVYLELAEFLNNKHFYSLSIKCLEYITDQTKVRV
jgi:hypothetical protein